MLALQDIRVTQGGRLVLPAPIRKCLNIRDGDTLSAYVTEGEIRLQSRREALRRIQSLVRRHVPAGVSLVDELLAERRAAAVHEANEAGN